MSALVGHGGLAPKDLLKHPPLVDLARGKGFAAFSAAEGADLVRTYFRREGAASAAPNEQSSTQ